MSIVSRVDHVLTKETSENRFSAVIWPISTYCMLSSQRITFTPQCRFAALQITTRSLEHSHCSANLTRTVRVHREHLPMWSECTGRTRRSGCRVYTGNPTRTVRERYARRVKLGHINTGTGSLPDSSEPNASGRLRVEFAFTLLTTDPTRTVRVRFAVYTLRLLRDRL